MKEKLAALHDNNTWELVPCTINTNVVGSKWAVQIKTKEDGSVDRL